MKRIIKYKILHAQKIVIEYYSGPISLDDIKELKSTEIKDKDFNPNYNILMDGRETKLITNHQDILDLINYIKSNPKIIGNRNSSFLTSTPDQVAKTTLLKLQSDIFPMNYNIFSTLYAALAFIRVPKDSYLIVEGVLNEMKNNTA